MKALCILVLASAAMANAWAEPVTPSVRERIAKYIEQRAGADQDLRFLLEEASKTMVGTVESKDDPRVINDLSKREETILECLKLVIGPDKAYKEWESLLGEVLATPQMIKDFFAAQGLIEHKETQDMALAGRCNLLGAAQQAVPADGSRAAREPRR